ncbi:MAG: pyridoxamine 5'-phosphate oxidase [Burkholderiales bacterium]|nr:MAG: pyridoxamine 5'-phosphate oxidase [Burkholderiales bacterium]RPH66208.1 MAG: pyridoxamine 5'-phosphate oxidase [Burkholderiales bacterium]
MPDALRQRVLDYLRTHHVMTLATQGDKGPWAAAAFYVNDDFTLYFLSAPSTRHCTELAGHARVAATIHEDYADWPQIRGIQLEGIASELADEDADRARRLYGDKYPIVGKLAQAPAAIVEAMAKIRWYRVVPDRLYFIDNSAGFGHRDELIPGAGSHPPGT